MQKSSITSYTAELESDGWININELETGSFIKSDTAYNLEDMR